MKSLKKDPWVVNGDEDAAVKCDEEVSVGDDLSLEFEDSFVASVIFPSENSPDSTCFSTTHGFSRLSDSAEYLASLESKLAKLKSKRKGKDIVQSLEEKHRSCMEQMLSSDSPSALGDEDFILDTPVSSNHPLLRYVAPDKQALTLGELVELLKADHLSQGFENQEQDFINGKSLCTGHSSNSNNMF